MAQIDWFKKYKNNLEQIQSLLQELNLWSEVAPSAKAMQSSMPFAVDTMPFENWLQFIFLPKMMESVEQRRLPPGPAQISPIAEEVYKGQADIKPLIDILKKFDEISHLSHLH